MFKIFYLLVYCFFYFYFSTNAHANYNLLDLSKTYLLAVENDDEFKIQQFSSMADKEKINQARAALLPQIKLSAKSIYNKANLSLENSGNNSQKFHPKYNANAYEINLIQPLFRWNLLQNYRQAENLLEKADIEFLKSQQQLILKTARLFFDFQIAKQNLTAAETNLLAISQQLDLAKHNFDVGIATITDFHEAQAQFDLANAQKITAQNQVEIARLNLQNLIANSANSFKLLELNNFDNVNKLQQKIQLLLQNLDLTQAKQIAKTNNLDIKLQKFNLQIAQKETLKSRGNFLPDIDFVAQHAKSKDLSQVNLSPLHANVNSVGVMVSMPIFQSGLTLSQIRENLYKQQAAESAVSLAEKSAVLKAEQFFLITQNGLAEILALKSAWQSSLSALQATKTAAEIGLRINLDILNAETQIYQTKLKLFRSIFETIFSALSLKATIGDLSEQDINLINQILFD